MLWVEGWAEHWQEPSKADDDRVIQNKEEEGRTKEPKSWGSTSQTHRRLKFYDKQINHLEIKISFRIICMFSVVTSSFSDLYFILVILTAYFEEEEVRGTPTPN